METTSHGVIEYIRQDLVDRYPPDRVKQFIDTSRDIHEDIQYLDDQMGPPEASLHVLEEGLVIQFHFSADNVIFLSIDKDIGRNFTRFIRDCIDHMS